MNDELISKTRIILILILIFPLFAGNGFTNNQNVIRKSQETRTTEWILDLQANDMNDTQWYFDHLTNNDRKKVRQALDWAIPRDNIINTVLEGLGIATVSSITPYFNSLVNKDPVPKTYNLTKAGDLLTEVFGYRFNQFTNDPSTVYDETKPYFKMTLLYPSNYALRIDYASDIKIAWQKIGIKVTVQEFDKIKTYDYLGGEKKDFDHGGFDAFLIGWRIATYIPFEISRDLGLNTTFDEYINTILRRNWEPNITQRNQALLNYQNWVYDNVPRSYILIHDALNAKNKNLMGFNPLTQFNYENWTFPGKDSIVIAMGANWVYDNLNPKFAYVSQFDFYDVNDVESKYSMGSMFRGMFFSTTEDNDSSFSNWKTYPYFADWYNTSTDGLTWFVNLKEGLKWHDGVDLNASDVEFTFNSMLQNETKLPGYGYYSTLVKQLTVLNSTMMKFEFNKPDFIKELLLSATIIPKHILEYIPYSEWANHTTNTGIDGGIIGNGPYTFVNKSSDLTSINLQKWDYWNDSYNSLIKNNKMGETVPGANVPSIKNLKFIIDYNGSDIINGIKNDSIDIKVGHFWEWKDQSFFNQITDPVEPLLVPSGLFQELNYNLFSPIWGIFPTDPKTIYTETITTTPTTAESSSSTQTSDFDIFAFFSAVVVIASISVYSKRKKQC